MHVQRMQASFGGFLDKVARRCAERSGRFERGQIGAIVPVFEAENATDTGLLADAAEKATGALALAEDRGWITPEEAAELFRRFLGDLAIDPTNHRTQASGAGRHLNSPS